jgi:hypothetical protein
MNYRKKTMLFMASQEISNHAEEKLKWRSGSDFAGYCIEGRRTGYAI